MPGAPLLGNTEPRFVLLVVSLEVFFAHHDLIGQAFTTEHQILDAGRFGRLELLLMTIIVGLDLRLARVHARCVVSGRKAKKSNLAAFCLQCDDGVANRPGKDGRPIDRIGQRLHCKLAADTRFEDRRRQVLRTQQGLVPRLIEAAIRLAQSGNAEDVLPDLLIGDDNLALGCIGGDRFLRDQPIKHFLAGFGCVEELGIERVAHHLTHLIDALSHRLVKLGLRNRHTADRGKTGIARRGALVTGNPEKHECRKDEDQQHELQQALMFSNGVKHGLGSFRKRLAKRGELSFAPCLRHQSGGVDGARTRDPRRDRPVF